jgi:hypothetical protein
LVSYIGEIELFATWLLGASSERCRVGTLGSLAFDPDTAPSGAEAAVSVAAHLLSMRSSGGA